MNYLAEEGKSYFSLEEFESRLENFKRIDLWINEYNSNPEHTATMGHN